ncbi:MAG: OmpA family protein [Saprospiraceae bacterium]
MNKNFLLALLLFSSTIISAQAPASTASIFFETDKSELSTEAQKTLDALAPTLLQAPDYQVNIEAFTDDRGTERHNLRLAADRAASVKNYLAAKGLIADKTSVQNWGERKAAGPTELGRQKSRRVDVAVNAFFFNDFDALRDRLSANTEQVLKIQSGQEQRVTAAKGTLVIIPANAFVFEDGTSPSGEVDLLVQEAYDPSDFVLHNLTTMSDGRILQTGGMVSITAQSGGRELKLAEGAALTVSIPNGGNFDPSMELFYAQPVANGGVDWKPAGQKFRKTLRPTRVELSIDPELGKRIAALKVREYPKPGLPVFAGKMPPEPKMSAAPYKPRPPKKPEWNNAQRMFGGGSGEMTRMSRKELKKAQKYFNQQMENYERDSAKYVQLAERYQRNVEGHEKAKIRYAQELRIWENELQARLRAILLYQREMRLHLYSKSLAKTLKVKAKTIQEYETYSNLYWVVDDAADSQAQLMMLGAGVSDDTQKSIRETGNLYESIIGTKIMDTYKDFRNARGVAYTSIAIDTTYRVISRMLSETGLKAISDSLQNEIKERTLLTSKSPEQLDYALKGYVATVSKLGWINCDRFYNDPSEKMEVLINEAEDATLYAVCKDINAMLPFQRNSAGTYAANGLPKGKKITVIAIKIKDGMPQFAQRDMKVGEAALSSMVYKSLPLRDLKEELKKLNI